MSFRRVEPLRGFASGWRVRVARQAAAPSSQLGQIMRERGWASICAELVVDQAIQNAQFQVREDKLGAGLRRDAIRHGARRRASSGCRRQRAGEWVKQSITGLLSRRLKLKVNEEKSAVARPVKRKFPGFSFTAKGRQRVCRPLPINTNQAQPIFVDIGVAPSVKVAACWP
jgi:hypothetical protein